MDWISFAAGAAIGLVIGIVGTLKALRWAIIHLSELEVVE